VTATASSDDPFSFEKSYAQLKVRLESRWRHLTAPAELTPRTHGPKMVRSGFRAKRQRLDGTPELLNRRPHPGHDPDLLQEAEHVLVRPLLDELAVLDPMDYDGCHLHVVPGSRDARKIALVFAVGG
jgi:hypothetical protein